MKDIRKSLVCPSPSLIGLFFLLILGAHLFTTGCSTSKPLLCYYNYAEDTEFTFATKENHPVYSEAQLKEIPIFIIIDFDLDSVKNSMSRDNITTLIKLHDAEQFYGILTFSDSDMLKGYGKIIPPSAHHDRPEYKFDPRTGEYTFEGKIFEIATGKTPVEKLPSLYTGKIVIPWQYVRQVRLWKIKDKEKYRDVEEAWQ
jgi:hypothetical protein